MSRTRHRTVWALALLVAGCDLAPIPVVAPAPVPVPPPPVRSAASLELDTYYARVQRSLVAQGLLRGDGGGVDVPFDADDLARNFERIALFEEYANIGGRLVARQTASQVHRWDVPVRLSVEFGATVPAAKQTRDRAAITSYAARLSAITGLPIRQVREAPNFHVFIVHEDERRALAPRLRAIIPGIDQAALDTVIDLPRSSYCLVFAYDPQGDGTYAKAVAIIRAEHSDILRLSCIHEEIAQGLGLSNDSPAARPSIFNDDEEFGLLTTHDEYLLQMLYDPRMTPGLSADEARPIAETIAAELLGADS